MMMSKAAKIIITLTLLAMTGIWLFGCGSGSDLLDENEQRYQASISFSDGGEDDTLDIDVIRTLDCDGDINTTDPETFTNVFADITVSVSASQTAGITLKSYRIEYIPLQTPDGNGGLVDPPALAEPEDGQLSYPIPAGTTRTFTITWLNFSTKDEYATWFWSNGVFARYQMRVTLYFEDEFGEEREISTWRTVYMGDYDRC